MIELTNEEKQLLIGGLYGILNEIEWQLDFPYIDDQTEKEYFTYYNNKKQVVKQLLEKLS